MMNYKKISNGFAFLMADKRITIVHGVLKSLGISPRRDDYDDLVQEGVIIFALAYADYQTAHPEDDNERDLMCFAYQRMRWRLLDCLRRQQLGKTFVKNSLDQEEGEQDYHGYLADKSALTPFFQLENSDFFADLYQHCNPHQQRYLTAKLKDQLTDTEIARQYGVSRSAVSQWRRGVIARARQLHKQ